MKKKIISFSLWGDNTLYTKGAIKNARAQQKFYPDWICRFYIDKDSIPAEVLEELSQYPVEIRPMGHTTDVLGMYWRFHPMFDDPDVERFIVRDTDSLFTKREAVAVGEWESSGLPFHIMRDCESHDVCILGGTWGAVVGCIPNFYDRMSSWFSRLQPCYANPRGLFHGSDQAFLAQEVWPLIKHNHLAHIRRGMDNIRFMEKDKYFSSSLSSENGHYVGMVC